MTVIVEYAMPKNVILGLKDVQVVRGFGIEEIDEDER